MADIVLKPAGLHAIQCGLGKWPGLHAIEQGYIAHPSYVASASFACDGIHCDSAEYLEGAVEFADGPQFTVTGFFKSGSTSQQVLFTAGMFFISLESDGTIKCYADDGSKYILATTTETFNDDAWHSMLVSVDTNYSAGNKKIHIVIDRTELSPTIDDISSAFSIDRDFAAYYIGPNYAGGEFEIAEATMEDTYIDFSVSSNVDKFVTASNKPANIGSDGSTAYGFPPQIYLHIDDGEAAANFATNRGSGSDFTITGTLSTSSTSPSD